MNHYKFNFEKNFNSVILSLLLLFTVSNVLAHKLEHDNRLVVKIEWQDKKYNLDLNKIVIRDNCKSTASKN